jgi:hypothetical protein
MKRTLIYLDTSVIGGCFEPEFAQWSNGLLNDLHQGIYKGVTSQIVAIEIARAPDAILEKYNDFLSIPAEILPINDEVMTLVDAYLGHGILTEKYRNDLLHIAIASVHSVDILTSWNFKHIVRYDKIVKFNAVNLEYGYHQIAIYSPREITTYGTD